jgi:hypothetical protein
MGVCDSRWYKMKCNSGATRFPSCFYSIFTSLLTKGRRPRIREKKKRMLRLSPSLFSAFARVRREKMFEIRQKVIGHLPRSFFSFLSFIDYTSVDFFHRELSEYYVMNQTLIVFFYTD